MKRLLLTLAITLLSLGAVAQQAKPAAPTVEASLTGYVELDKDYGVFPENRIGNALYLKKKKIFARQDLAIRDILLFKDGLAYLGFTDQEAPIIGWQGPEGTKVSKLDGDYFVLEGPEKALLRIDPKGKIQDLLPKSSTAGNLLHNGQDKAVFTHISAGETIETDGKTRYLYTYRLHVVRKSSPKVENLRGEYKSFDSKLNYSWANPNELEIHFGEGEVQKLSIR